jgi:hypothetical protein
MCTLDTEMLVIYFKLQSVLCLVKAISWKKLSHDCPPDMAQKGVTIWFQSRLPTTLESPPLSSPPQASEINDYACLSSSVTESVLIWPSKLLYIHVSITCTKAGDEESKSSNMWCCSHPLHIVYTWTRWRLYISSIAAEIRLDFRPTGNVMNECWLSYY